MVNSHALRLVPSRNESRWFHALNRVSWTRSSARSRSPQSDTANARRLVISPTRDSRRLSDTFRAKLFVSASLEVFQKLEQTIGDWLSRNFVEHGTQMAADMGLQIGRQTLFRGERCALPRSGCLSHGFPGVRWLPPAFLFLCLVHNRPQSAGDAIKTADTLHTLRSETRPTSSGSRVPGNLFGPDS